MAKITIYIDETALTPAQKVQFAAQLTYWQGQGLVTEIGPPAKPRP